MKIGMLQKKRQHWTSSASKGDGTISDWQLTAVAVVDSVVCWRTNDREKNKTSDQNQLADDTAISCVCVCVCVCAKYRYGISQSVSQYVDNLATLSASTELYDVNSLEGINEHS